MAQRKVVPSMVAVGNWPTTTISGLVHVHVSRRRDQAKRSRSQSAPEVPVPKPADSTTRTSPAESESEAAAKLAKLESVIANTRVRAGHGHPRKRLDECQQYMVRAAKRLEIAKQWSPQLQSRIVFKMSTTSGPSDWRS